MPSRIELGTLNDAEVVIDENSGKLVITTDANEVDIDGANLTNAGNVPANPLTEALDADGNDITNVGALDADEFSLGDDGPATSFDDIGGGGGGVSTDQVFGAGGGLVASGDAGVIQTVELADGDTLDVYSASLHLSDASAAPSDLDLDLVISGAFQSSILTGDGSTVYVDEQNTDPTSNPIESYTNSSGSPVTAMVLVNNGAYSQSGSGSDQNAYGDVVGEVV